MKNVFLFLVLVLFFISCSLKKNVAPANVFSITIDEKHKSLSADSVFSSVKYIPLETTKESLMYEIFKLQIINNNIYILDAKQHVIMLFDNNGRFLNKINRTGKGPGEYLSIDDFFVRDSFIYILSSSSQKILIFDQALKHIKSFKTDAFPSRMEYVYNNLFVYNCFNSRDLKNFHIFDLESGKLKSKFVSYRAKQTGAAFHDSALAKNDSLLHYFLPYDYHIYQMTEKGESVFLKLDFGKDKMFTDDFKEYSQDERSAFIDRNYVNMCEMPVPGIDDLFVSDDLIFFSFVYSCAKNHLFWDRKQNKVQFGYLLSTPKFLLAQSNLLYVNKEYMVSFAFAEDVLSSCAYFKKNNTAFPDLFLSLKPEDNPILCIHTLL